MFCTSGPNLVILAWMGQKLSPGESKGWHRDKQLHTQTRRRRRQYLGLALLTLSWDKNWDSHSLVNGYPSFYSVSSAKPWRPKLASGKKAFNTGNKRLNYLQCCRKETRHTIRHISYMLYYIFTKKNQLFNTFAFDNLISTTKNTIFIKYMATMHKEITGRMDQV